MRLRAVVVACVGCTLLLVPLFSLAARNRSSVAVMRLLLARRAPESNIFSSQACRWMTALQEYARTGAGAGCLESHLRRADLGERRIRADQLLATAAALRDPNRAAIALRVTTDVHHDSAVGYMILANALQGMSGADAERREALEAAAACPAGGAVQIMRRGEAWYWLGREARTRDEALRAYSNVLSADPRDTSWGYSWMAAIEKARLHVASGEWDDAAAALRSAAALPDRYGRKAAALLDVTYVECRKGSEAEAMQAIQAGGEALAQYRGRPCTELLSLLHGKTDFPSAGL